MALVWRNGKAVHAMMASSFDLPNPVVWWNGMNRFVSRFVVESDENTLEKIEIINQQKHFRIYQRFIHSV